MSDWFILDRDYRILEANTHHRLVEAHIGKTLWDAFPGSHETYADMYQRAWEHGRAEGHSFYLGRFCHVAAERTDEGLRVAYEVLVELNAVTLTALQQSLDRIRDLLEAADEGSPPTSARHLRSVPRVRSHRQAE